MYTPVHTRNSRKRMKSQIGVMCCLSVIFFGLMSCTPTIRLTTVWKDETLQGKKIEKVFVRGTLWGEANRELFENEFVKELKARGVDAVASYTVIPFEKAADEETIKTAARVLNRDTILTVRMVNTKTVNRSVPTESFRPCVYRDWPGTPSPCWTDLVPGTATVEDVFLILETNLYDAGTDRLLWSAQSEIWVVESDAVMMKSFVQVMLDRLSQDKMI